MSEDTPLRDRRHQRPVLLGVLGAVLGFVGTFFLVLPSNPVDPVTSGLIVLFVCSPIGAVIGAFLGAKLGLLIRPQPLAAERPAAPPSVSARTSPAGVAAGSTTGSALKALGIAFGTAAVLIGGYVFYDYQTTTTPWLRPDGTELHFEVRLPAGAAMPPADVKAELQTSVNTMPADMKPNLFRSDGGRPVIVGEVSLAFRASWRQLEVKIPGRGDTTHAIKIAKSPSHAEALGPWQPHPDGSEFRYRVKWPGKQ
jgi:hypothetical protein